MLFIAYEKSADLVGNKLFTFVTIMFMCLVFMQDINESSVYNMVYLVIAVLLITGLIIAAYPTFKVHKGPYAKEKSFFEIVLKILNEID